jgi:hypothetical protein
MVVLEVNTRRAASSQERRNELAEALAFTRHNLGQDDLPGGGAFTPPGSASPVRR